MNGLVPSHLTINVLGNNMGKVFGFAKRHRILVALFIIFELTSVIFAVRESRAEPDQSVNSVQISSPKNVNQASTDYSCKDRNGEVSLDLREPTPDILIGIQKILIKVSLPNNVDFKAMNLSQTQVENEVICQFENYLRIKKKPITVRLLSANGRLSASQDMQNPKTLFVLVRLNDQKASFNNYTLNIVTLQQNFFRSSVNNVDDLTLQCASSFIGELNDPVNKLSDAIRACMPRHLAAETVLKDPNSNDDSEEFKKLLRD